MIEKLLRYILGEPVLHLTSAATGKLYLTRYSLFVSNWFALYVHRIDGPDPDLHLHNHPWEALVIVLRKPGRYVQHVMVRAQSVIARSGWVWSMRRQYVGRFNVLGSRYHKITDITPGTWTLCICGPRRARDWGFLVDGQHMNWVPYTRDIGKKQMIGVVSGNKQGGY